MKILHQLDPLPSHTFESALTLGTFDGVHLGHQKIFHKARTLIGEKGRLIAICFHPSPAALFHPDPNLKPIITIEEKIELLEKNGIDLLYLIPFNKEMAEKTYDLFLQELLELTDMSYLVLGSDATFGKKREGNRKNVERLTKKLGIEAHYLEKDHISSTKVRKAIAEKKYDKASALLGRAYHPEKTPS